MANHRPPFFFGVLAAAHLAWGAALLAGAAWFAVSALRTLPHLHGDSVLAGLLAVLSFAAAYAAPSAILGAWMVVVASRLWGRRAGLRKTLLLTHGTLLPFGILAIVLGVIVMRAANRSASLGGGLLGPVAAFPLMIGIPATTLSVCSIGLALSGKSGSGSRSPGARQEAKPAIQPGRKPFP